MLFLFYLIRMGASKIKEYQARPQQLLKLPKSLSDEGNFGNFSKNTSDINR